NTTSAADSPTHGRAGPEFSTLTPITGLVSRRDGSSIGTPVSGHRGGGGGSVVGSAVGVVVVAVVAVAGAGAGSGDEQPVSTHSRAAATPRSLVMSGLVLTAAGRRVPGPL